MSEFTQVDLQIGTEEQFEAKKANLSEGVIVGLTDPIHENELDSSLQTKIDGIKSFYRHDVTITATNPSISWVLTVYNTSNVSLVGQNISNYLDVFVGIATPSESSSGIGWGNLGDGVIEGYVLSVDHTTPISADFSLSITSDIVTEL